MANARTWCAFGAFYVRRRNGKELFRNGGHFSLIRSVPRTAKLQIIYSLIIIAGINNKCRICFFDYKNRRAVVERYLGVSAYECEKVTKQYEQFCFPDIGAT